MSILDWIIFIVSALIFAASVLTVLHHVFFGLNHTNLNDRYFWGLNIQGFFVFSSIGAGMLAVIAGFVIFWDVNSWVLQLSAKIAFSCLLSAMMLMGADLGKPFRVWRIITGRNFASPLTLDFFCVIILAILSFIFMFGIFMNIPIIFTLWAYVTLLVVILCLIAHVLLFVLRKTSDTRVKSFEALNTVICGLWAGMAVFVAVALTAGYGSLFINVLFILTFVVFASQVGCIMADILAGHKPHNLIVTGMSFIALALLAARGLLLTEVWINLWIVEMAICALIVFTFVVEKFTMVIGHQNSPILPHPYNMYDDVKPYRPSFSEVGNLIAVLSLVVAATYAIIIVRAFILPFIIRQIF